MIVFTPPVRLDGALSVMLRRTWAHIRNCENINRLHEFCTYWTEPASFLRHFVSLSKSRVRWAHMNSSLIISGSFILSYFQNIHVSHISVGCHSGYSDRKNLIRCHRMVVIPLLCQEGLHWVVKKAQRYCFLPSIVLKIHRVLLIGLLWNLISSTVFCPVRSMFCINCYPPLKEKDTGYKLRQHSHHRALPFSDNSFIGKNFKKMFTDIY